MFPSLESKNEDIMWWILLPASCILLAVLFMYYLDWRERKLLLLGGKRWDVVVVGGGAAGLTASLSASESGQSVLLLDASSVGGTTARSGGGVWIPDNHFKREAGGTETESSFLEYVRQSKGDSLTPIESRRASSFFRHAKEAISFLVERGVRMEMPSNVSGPGRESNLAYVRSKGLPDSLASTFCDYSLVGNSSGVGRTLHPEPSLYGILAQLPQTLREISILTLLRYTPYVLSSKYSKQGNGADLVSQLVSIVKAKENVTILERTRVMSVEREAGGWILHALEGKIRSRKVIVSCGGAGADGSRASSSISFPVRSSCSDPSARGDLLGAGGSLSKPSAWLKQTWTEKDENEYTLGGALGIWFIAGSSSFVVDKRGKRFVNEHKAYPLRAKAQIEEARSEVVFYICDEFTRRRYASLRATGGVLPETPLCGGSEPEWMHKSNTWEELLDNAKQSLLKHVPGANADSFVSELRRTREAWDSNSSKGEDPHFGRGSTENLVWPYIHPDDASSSNPSVRPFLTEGPYYCVALSVAVLDTVGEIYTDERWRALDPHKRVLPGLCAAGNSAVPILDKAVYLSGGFTLGHAICSGFLAGRSGEEEEEV